MGTAHPTGSIQKGDDVVLTLLLPWFPILLSVGIGGRLLGRTRGLFLGIVAAMFWIVLVQAWVGSALWHNYWIVAAIVAGSVAIAAMGCWSGDFRSSIGGQFPPYALHAKNASDSQSSVGNGQPQEAGNTLEQLSAAMDQFDDWLEEHRDESKLWPKFDELIRSVLYQCCKATHVRPFRLLNDGDELVPLREPDPFLDVERLSARSGIIGHVVTTGRSYLSGDVMQGELLVKLAEQSKEQTAWCFAIKQGTRRLGIVTIAELGIAPERNKPLLHAMERLINQFWCTLWETIRSRSAVQEDPVSGLPTRPAFLRAAEQALHESYQQGEPVAVVVLALESLRDLSDTGRWEVADDLIHEVSDVVRRKVRMDDRLGRFDGSRFILLLRRVDTELASLIVEQLLARVTAICSDETRWRVTVEARCGLAGSGTLQPDLRTLVSRALAQSRRARLEGIRFASDTGNVAAAACGGRI